MLKTREISGLFVKVLSSEYKRFQYLRTNDPSRESCDNCGKFYTSAVVIKSRIKMIEGYDDFIDINHYCFKCCKKNGQYITEISSSKRPKLKQKQVIVLWNINHGK